jgi:hypothetical protein
MKRATEAQSGLLTTDRLAGYEEFSEKEGVTSSETRLSF